MRAGAGAARNGAGRGAMRTVTYEELQGTVVGLNAVVMLGSFMHAAPSSAAAAELAAGGLAAVTRLPLAAVAWYPDGPDAPPAVTPGRAGGPGSEDGVGGALRLLCPRLHRLRPTWSAGAAVPSELRRAGVQTLLAVPLRVSTESLGYLLAGGRTEAVPEDLTLVQALSAQASTALYVARLRETEERRVRALDELAGDLRAQGDLLARALALQEELIDLVLRGKDAHAIVGHLADRIGAPVWLLDAERRVLGHAGCGPRAVVPPRASELARVLNGHQPEHAPRSVDLGTAAGVRPFLVQRVATHRETFGYLMVGSTELGPVDHTTFQGGRLVLALRLLIERSVAEAEERLGRDLLHDALLRGGDGTVPAALAARLGYRGDGPAVVVVLRLQDPDDPERSGRRAFAVVRDELRAGDRGLAGMIGADVVAIIRPEAAERCVRRLLERVGPAVPAAVGTSDVREGLGDLEPAYREALVAAAMAPRAPGGALRFRDLGLHRLLFDTDHIDRLDEHVERWIGPLLRYDARNRGSLVETLGVYLRGDGHLATARRLAVHPSTLKYRLGRIREILDVDIADADVRFNVELAVRLADGMRRIAGPG
ncbi:PucR family transcriptional regulator [Pseudonocardia sp.]|uniref:PucR family transcriptional regulator n=1 Tax=Pseudonocardia sp. TaxID=60912 RepID=UPI003D11BF50